MKIEGNQIKTGNIIEHKGKLWKAINKGGGFGSIIGRNSFQRPKQKAIQLISDITNIYKGK